MHLPFPCLVYGLSVVLLITPKGIRIEVQYECQAVHS